MIPHGRGVAPDSRRAKIVIVDDDPLVRGLVRLHLVNDGYDVLEAEDGIAGGYLALGESPDLVICDVDMPYMSGYELAAALKSDPATERIPLVFLTVAEDVESQATKLGAAAYLRKPVLANQLLQVVHRVIGNPASDDGY